ncbi:hypothetical protein ANN_20703 [Periplaneta americana]|uniref:DUF4817 domain-containing protein n=1 Tax=Periplaneta americana TaxID=6978 RepID=A0ABQ8SDE8_PERAM|nr:hypothetical protein ANN_20703 [Periplaneta americana]
MAGLCVGGNEPPGSIKASEATTFSSPSYCLKVPKKKKRAKTAQPLAFTERRIEAGEGKRDATYANGRQYLCENDSILKALSSLENANIFLERTVYYDQTNMEISLQLIRNSSFRSLPSKETLRGHSDSSFRGEGYIQCCVGVRLREMYSNQELAEIHFMYGKADGNAALARRLYQERYPQRQCPDRKTFVRLHYRLCEYGKFNSPGLGRGRPRYTTPEVQEEILEAVNMTPSISTRMVALQVNVWRLLKEYQLYPYHLQRVQALSPADYPARVRFCQWFLQQCGVNPNFPALVLFTDEAQFTRDGITNFHNQHVWA